MRRLILHLAPRRGSEERVSDLVRSEACHLRDVFSSSATVTSMTRVPDDPFGGATRFRSTLEVKHPELAPREVASHLDGLALRFAGAIHADLSTTLVGEEHVFIDHGKAPLRYQYLMRRNSKFTHEAYVKRYAEIHSQFGLRTPGIEGYVQFYVDPELSREISRATGLGVWGVDSISELHLSSVDEFLAEISKSSVGLEAIADEEKFVDRDNSHDFTSSVDPA